SDGKARAPSAAAAFMTLGCSLRAPALFRDRLLHFSDIGSRPRRDASWLKRGRYVVTTRSRRSVSAFSSACSSAKIGSALPIGRPSPVTTTRRREARRLLVLIGKLSGSWLLWFRTW